MMAVRGLPGYGFTIRLIFFRLPEKLTRSFNYGMKLCKFFLKLVTWFLGAIFIAWYYHVNDDAGTK